MTQYDPGRLSHVSGALLIAVHPTAGGASEKEEIHRVNTTIKMLNRVLWNKKARVVLDVFDGIDEHPTNGMPLALAC